MQQASQNNTQPLPAATADIDLQNANLPTTHKKTISGSVLGINAPLAWDQIELINAKNNLCFASHPGFRRIGYEHTLARSLFNKAGQRGLLADFDRTAHHYEEYFHNFLELAAVTNLPVIITVACQHGAFKDGVVTFTPVGGAESFYARFLNQTCKEVEGKFSALKPAFLVVPTAAESSEITPSAQTGIPEEFRAVRQLQTIGRSQLQQALTGHGLYVNGGSMEQCLSGAIESFCLGADIRPLLNGCYSDGPESTLGKRSEAAPPALTSIEVTFPPFDIGRRGARTALGELELLRALDASRRVLLSQRTVR